MKTEIEAYRLMNFVHELYDLHSLHQIDMERCHRWIDAVIPPPAEVESPACSDNDLNDESAVSWVEKLCDYYHGYDYVEDALAIAKIVACNDSLNENTAEHLLNSIGYTLGMLFDWKLSPELSARATQIRSIALPGIDGEVEVAA